MDLNIEKICGTSNESIDIENIGNDPNFVFVNDPNYETITLFDFEGNIINVNSWLECANYVNGGWTNNVSDFINGEKYLFFLTLGSLVIYLIYKKFIEFKRENRNLSAN